MKPGGERGWSWFLSKEAWWKIMTVVEPWYSIMSRWSRRLLVGWILKPLMMCRLCPGLAVLQPVTGGGPCFVFIRPASLNHVLDQGTY